jgi:tRNA-dihydrouridine synthase
MILTKSLSRPFFVLAPMDDVTDIVFRQIVSETAAPDLYMTEFVNVDGLQSVGRDKLMHRLLKRPSETNLIAQIWGKNPINYQKTANELVDMGFAGVDINMGCPDKAVVKNGCCSALIENRELAVDIIKSVKKGTKGRVPVSVKSRVGYNQVDLTWPSLLLEQNIDMLTIHGRTKKQMSKVPADWDLIGQIREQRDKLAPNTLVVGNGDVQSRMHGEQLANKYNLDGIMIGRAVFNDPYVFSKESPWPTLEPRKKIELYKKQVELFIKYYPNKERSPQTLKRYAKIYINGFGGAHDLRSKVMDQSEADDMLIVLDKALAAV